jgi:hypothetical protein
MSFERGSNRGPDIRVTAKSKESGQSVTLGAAWIDDGDPRPSLRLDRDVVGIMVVMKDGTRHKITTGKEGTHYINMFLNFLGERSAPSPEPPPPSSDFDDGDDFSWA